MSANDEFLNIGKFIEDKNNIVAKLNKIKAIIFDWDGVFHNGYKTDNSISSFSEADSMGINMLRFSYYLKNNTIPYTAIITGENNKTASYFAKREHFNQVFLKIKNKIEVLDWLTKHEGFTNEEVLFVFDDILDLSIAKVCGLRFLVNRHASFMFKSYCKQHNLCDYITRNSGGNHAIREICELSIALLGNYDQVLDSRIAYTADYSDYLTIRNAITFQESSLK